MCYHHAHTVQIHLFSSVTLRAHKCLSDCRRACDVCLCARQRAGDR